jgi:hypothetical protein
VHPRLSPACPSGGPNHGWRGPVQALALLAALLPAAAQATSLTVPDDVATIQAAFDARVDTVFVRAGIHNETPTASAGVVIIGLGREGAEPPTVSGMWYLADHSLGHPDLFIKGLKFTGSVGISSSGGGATITFQDCHFLGGIRDFSSDPPASTMAIRRCRIIGNAFLNAEGYCFVDSCVIESGSLVIAHDFVTAYVRDCELRGAGSGAAIRAERAISVEILSNVISNYSQGMMVEVDRAKIEGNTVRDCSGSGIRLFGSGSVSGNQVERCGGFGIDLFSDQSLIVANNTISDCAESGLVAASESDAKIIGNTTYRNGRDGINVGGLLSGSFEMRNNTSAFNRGCGYQFYTGTLALSHNVGFGNERHGIEWMTPDAPVSRCNSWFGNGLGDLQGLAPSPDDLFVDPLFCDPANGVLRPSAASPLLTTSACGPIGALGVGCYAPGMLYAAFHLTRVGPSPGGGRMNIEFEVPRAAAIEIEVFDILGRRVAAPARGTWPAGRHSVAWMHGQAGVYLVRYRFPGGQEQRRVVRTP